MFTEIADCQGTATMCDKGLFIHLSTFSDGYMNVEHWRGIERNGACIRLVDPDEDAVIGITHFPIAGHALRELSKNYKIALPTSEAAE